MIAPSLVALDEPHDHLQNHLGNFVADHAGARRLKGLTPDEFICKASSDRPERLILKPSRQMLDNRMQRMPGDEVRLVGEHRSPGERIYEMSTQPTDAGLGMLVRPPRTASNEAMPAPSETSPLTASNIERQARVSCFIGSDTLA